MADATLTLEGGRVTDRGPLGAPKRHLTPWIGLLPFLLFLFLFLLLPTWGVVKKAFTDLDGGGFSTTAMTDAFTDERQAFIGSLKLSFVSAGLGVIFGVLIAYAAATAVRPRWLRAMVTAFSGVAANMGGIILAFLFITMLGRQGLATKILGELGFDLYNTSWFDLSGFWGWVTVYLYFQIPLMVLVTLPAIDGLKPAWREASSNLGGTTFTYWRRVGLPVLMPSMLGGFLLLFANAFSAYATVYALNTQANVLPVKISFGLRNDVGGRTSAPYALATWMIIVIAITMAGYLFGAQTSGTVAGRMTTMRQRKWMARLGPNLVLIFAAMFFVAPILSTARQALQKVPMPLLGWNTLFDKWSLGALARPFHEDNFWPTLQISLKLALATVIITLALLVPTALYVHLRLPRARALVEFLTVLPYVVPPVALAAGVAAFYRANARWFFTWTWALVPFYVVMALPFSYRSIDAGIKAIDVRTLVDASRSLGANWPTTFRRALLPNLSTALISASFLTATVVLGEFTIAVTLAKNTFPTFSFEYFGRDPQGGVALALLTLMGTTFLLGVLTLLTRTKSSRAGTKTVDFDDPLTDPLVVATGTKIGAR